ncbi:uncharacterized protein LOC122854040 [Aphidius gifuensis]|uniref:uncharacterized protein LOC122854040 n=1 Tax=Aphidius gifuensis TaxID=684658 RepID=UPI001CDCACD0|nr:uncharacterized protein LOC122854040 [Aphidius gifuensis]
MYVPVCERQKIALVCQKWKRVLDSCGNVKKLELTHWEYDEDSSYLTAYRHCNIVPVINECCPNLMELRLRFTFIDDVLLYNAFSRLSKLKVLAIIFQDINDEFIPLNLIYSLRNVADTLTDLVLLSWKKKECGYCIFPEETDCIDYQIHDYSYAKNIIIDHLNDDCLAEIFMYVPACERPKIALVCQKWKGALDHSWSNVKKLELTYWEYDEYPTCLKKYPTLDGQFTFLKTLIYKCGRYLTKLDLTAYSHCNIVPVINEYCPNLVELRLRFTSIDRVILYDAFSRLCKLKVLAIIFQNFNDKFVPHILIYSLKNVADTLTDLILLNWKEKERDSCQFSEETICVIRELKALKRVDISGIIPTEDLREYLYDKI